MMNICESVFCIPLKEIKGHKVVVFWFHRDPQNSYGV